MPWCSLISLVPAGKSGISSKMSMSGPFLFFRNALGSYRNVLCNRSSFPLYQSSASLKQSVEEKLGLPPKPKKPLTPFFRFMAQVRPSIVQKLPQAKLTEVVQLIAKQWANVGPAERQKLETEYKNEMNDYVAIKYKYDISLTDEQRNSVKQAKMDILEDKERRALKKKKKDLGKPKKPMTAFIAFMKNKQSLRGDIPFKDWQMRVAKEWESLPETEKANYAAHSKREMESYKRELQSWEEKMIRLGHIDMVRNEALIQPKSMPRPSRTSNPE